MPWSGLRGLSYLVHATEIGNRKFSRTAVASRLQSEKCAMVVQFLQAAGGNKQEIRRHRPTGEYCYAPMDAAGQSVAENRF